jgi:hypothetical protein
VRSSSRTRLAGSSSRSLWSSQPGRHRPRHGSGARAHHRSPRLAQGLASSAGGEHHLGRQPAGEEVPLDVAEAGLVDVGLGTDQAGWSTRYNRSPSPLPLLALAHVEQHQPTPGCLHAVELTKGREDQREREEVKQVGVAQQVEAGVGEWSARRRRQGWSRRCPARPGGGCRGPVGAWRGRSTSWMTVTGPQPACQLDQSKARATGDLQGVQVVVTLQRRDRSRVGAAASIVGPADPHQVEPV